MPVNIPPVRALRPDRNQRPSEATRSAAIRCKMTGRSPCLSSPRGEVSDVYPTVQEEVARLAAAPEVRSAFNWFRTQEPQLAHWQLEMARIAAPPFGETARGAWLAERFRELGLDDVRIDDVGNVFGIHPGLARATSP